jgi:hypothetical protein
MLSEICQTHKDKYCIILFTWGPYNKQIHRNRSRRDQEIAGRANWELPFSGEFLFEMMRRFLKWTVAMFVTILCVYICVCILHTYIYMHTYMYVIYVYVYIYIYFFVCVCVIYIYVCVCNIYTYLCHIWSLLCWGMFLLFLVSSGLFSWRMLNFVKDFFCIYWGDYLTNILASLYLLDLFILSSMRPWVQTPVPAKINW